MTRRVTIPDLIVVSFPSKLFLLQLLTLHHASRTLQIVIQYLALKCHQCSSSFETAHPQLWKILYQYQPELILLRFRGSFQPFMSLLRNLFNRANFHSHMDLWSVQSVWTQSGYSYINFDLYKQKSTGDARFCLKVFLKVSTLIFMAISCVEAQTFQNSQFWFQRLGTRTISRRSYRNWVVVPSSFYTMQETGGGGVQIEDINLRSLNYTHQQSQLLKSVTDNPK